MTPIAANLPAGHVAPHAALLHCALSMPSTLESSSLQVLAVYGSWHLGQLQVGLSGAVRLAQCHSLQLTMEEGIPMQIDGEPWFQPPAKVDISLHGKVRRHS